MSAYSDVYTPEALAAMAALAPFNADQKALMNKRMARRAERAQNRQPIAFLEANGTIPGSDIAVADARAGRFAGSGIPADLQRQWIQGTGPGAKPNAAIESSIRNVAYALLSGADGWMFDGEDALGQITTMSLDNQRNLKLAIDGDPIFLRAAEAVAGIINQWAKGFLGEKTIDDWRSQLDFTTKIFRARGLHLDDRHIRTMTYGFMRNYEDRVRRAVNTADTDGRCALWQGGMKPNIPVGSGTVWRPVWRGPWQVRGGSRARGLPASGWSTGRWCPSLGRCGRRWVRPISWAGPFHRSPTRKRMRRD